MRVTVFGSAALLCAAFLPSCIVPADAKANVTAGVDFANSYVHRGMIQNEEGVMQPQASIVIPAKRDGRIILRTWANMDLSNETGDAWLPDGHAGKFSQIDYNLLFAQRVNESLEVTGGFINYNLPNGLEFPFGERGATNEFLIGATYQLPDKLLALQPRLALHYDYDEVDGLYVNAGVSHAYEASEKVLVTSDLGLGWMDGNQTFWSYGLPDDISGMADLQLKVQGDYEFEPGTTFTGFLAYSRVMDSELRDWFDLIQIDADQVVASLGVRWQF